MAGLAALLQKQAPLLTVLADGTAVHATPNFDAASVQTAHDTGYNGDVLAMTRDHDPFHRKLSEVLGLIESPALRDAANGTTTELGQAEEAVIMALHAYVNLLRAKGQTVSIGKLLKYSPDQDRDENGRWSSGEESGSGDLKPGDKITVYRFGDNSPSLDNRNAGNALSVALHVASTQSDEGPQNVGGHGDTITMHEVTIGPKGIAGYQRMNGGAAEVPWNTPPGVKPEPQTQVGRTAGGIRWKSGPTQVAYSFPKGGDFTSRLVDSAPLQDFHDQLVRNGVKNQWGGAVNFDSAGGLGGALAIRQVFAQRAAKVSIGKLRASHASLALLRKYRDDQERDAHGRWTAGGDSATGSVPASSIPRAEPGALSARGVAVESRFARQIAQSIPAAMAAYAQLKDAGGGRILNTDTVRELSADYRGDRATLSPAVHEPASWLTKQMYAAKLAEPAVSNSVLFTAGGAGSGKSSGIRDIPSMKAVQDAADVVFDTNMNKFGSAKQKIDQALASGRDVQIAYVGRDPVESLTQGALPRAMGTGGGRTVPMSEHIATHVGAAQTIQEIAAAYADNPRVQIRYIDNTHGRNGAVLSDASLPTRLNFDNLSERLGAALEQEHAAGRISTPVYQGTKGSSGASH